MQKNAVIQISGNGEIQGVFWSGSVSYAGMLRTHGGEIMRTRITLACTDCKNRNYDTTKDKKTHPDRVEMKKYCPFCKKHTLHKEKK